MRSQKVSGIGNSTAAPSARAADTSTATHQSAAVQALHCTTLEAQFTFRDQGWGNRKGALLFVRVNLQRAAALARRHQCHVPLEDTLTDHADLLAIAREGNATQFTVDDDNLGRHEQLWRSPTAPHIAETQQVALHLKHDDDLDALLVVYHIGGGGGHTLSVHDASLCMTFA